MFLGSMLYFLYLKYKGGKQMKKLYKLFIFSTIESDYDVDDLEYYFDDLEIAKQAEKKS